MSRAWSWRNAILASRLQATTKHVLMVISTHMNDMGGGCYPSVKTIAELASLSERSVCTHIEIAAAAGWLEVQKHGFNGQGWARHEYKPLWPEGAERGSVHQGTEPLSEGTEPDDKKALNDVQSIELPNEHPKEVLKSKPTKASRRGSTPALRLDEFLRNSATPHDGLPPSEWCSWANEKYGWDVERISVEWEAFGPDFWLTDNCLKYDGGRKRDWFATWRTHCKKAHNSRGSRGSGGKADGGLAAALRTSVANRYGASQPDGGVGGREAAGPAEPDTGGTGSALKPGETPF